MGKRVEILIVVTEVIYLEDDADVKKIIKHLKECVKNKEYPSIEEEDGFKECEYITGNYQELYISPITKTPFIEMYDNDILIYES